MLQSQVETTLAGPVNPHASGTSGVSPAEQALVPEAEDT